MIRQLTSATYYNDNEKWKKKSKMSAEWNSFHKLSTSELIMENLQWRRLNFYLTYCFQNYYCWSYWLDCLNCYCSKKVYLKWQRCCRGQTSKVTKRAIHFLIWTTDQDWPLGTSKILKWTKVNIEHEIIMRKILDQLQGPEYKANNI